MIWAALQGGPASQGCMLIRDCMLTSSPGTVVTLHWLTSVMSLSCRPMFIMLMLTSHAVFTSLYVRQLAMTRRTSRLGHSRRAMTSQWGLNCVHSVSC